MEDDGCQESAEARFQQVNRAWMDTLETRDLALDAVSALHEALDLLEHLYDVRAALKAESGVWWGDRLVQVLADKHHTLTVAYARYETTLRALLALEAEDADSNPPD